MLLYIGFTFVWTLMLIFHVSIWRRIDRRIIMPIGRALIRYGVPALIRQTCISLLQLSIIPLGFVWAALLIFRSLRTTLT